MKMGVMHIGSITACSEYQEQNPKTQSKSGEIWKDILSTLRIEQTLRLSLVLGMTHTFSLSHREVPSCSHNDHGEC